MLELSVGNRRSLRSRSGCQRSDIILQITSAFLSYRACWTTFKNKVTGLTQPGPNWESGVPSSSDATVVRLRGRGGFPLRDAMLLRFAPSQRQGKTPSRLSQVNSKRAGHFYRKSTSSFCRSPRSCSAFFVWMTCIPNFEALSRFSGRSSTKQHSPGGFCVISRARR
jgi:hypothetical protein